MAAFVSDDSDVDHSDPYDLQDQLVMSMFKSALDCRHFLPQGLFSQLITEKSIKAELPKASRQLVEFTCKHTRKAFAIALCIGMDGATLVSALETFQRHGFSDQFLPNAKLRNIRNCQAKRAGECSHEEYLYAFHHPPWKLFNIRRFYETQWEFFAPVFTQDKSRLELHEDCVLPIT
jgi:hypothetical protein